MHIYHERTPISQSRLKSVLLVCKKLLVTSTTTCACQQTFWERSEIYIYQYIAMLHTFVPSARERSVTVTLIVMLGPIPRWITSIHILKCLSIYQKKSSPACTIGNEERQCDVFITVPCRLTAAKRVKPNGLICILGTQNGVFSKNATARCWEIQ